MMWLAVFYALGVCYTVTVMLGTMSRVPVNVPRSHRLWPLLATTRIVMMVVCVVLWPAVWLAGAVREVWRFVAWIVDVLTGGDDQEDQ